MTDEARSEAALEGRKRQHVIKDLETLKVLADPLRLRILELFHLSNTVKNVAAELDMPPTKLYYHIKQLEEHGLLIVVETRIVSGIVEKHYRTIADHLKVDKALLTPGQGNAGDQSYAILLTTLFDSTHEEFLDSVQAGLIDPSRAEEPDYHSAELQRTHLWLTPEQGKQFKQRFHELLKEFVQQMLDDLDNEDLQLYTLLTTFFPTSRNLPKPSAEELEDILAGWDEMEHDHVDEDHSG